MREGEVRFVHERYECAWCFRLILSNFESGLIPEGRYVYHPYFKRFQTVCRDCAQCPNCYSANLGLAEESECAHATGSDSASYMEEQAESESMVSQSDFDTESTTASTPH